MFKKVCKICGKEFETKHRSQECCSRFCASELKTENLVGLKFNKLTVIKKIGRNNYGKTEWLCKCDCGKETITTGNNLKSGNTKSCGCHNLEQIIKRNTKHNLRYTRIYQTWLSIKRRCYNKNFKEYHNYGGRGIVVCSEWLDDFMNFYNWGMSNGYKENLSIDRINVNGNYEPSNCRWATLKEQANNKTTNHFITYKGITKTITQWAEFFNIDKRLLQDRIKKLKWDFEKAVKTPTDEYKNRANKLIYYNGEYKTKEEWIRTLHIHPSTFYRRLKRCNIKH